VPTINILVTYGALQVFILYCILYCIVLLQKSSHNDVLNRLADMGDEPDRRKMLERLFAFMEERGTPIVAVPTISKLAVDLFRLYLIVKDFGGMVEVCVGCFGVLVKWSVQGRVVWPVK